MSHSSSPHQPQHSGPPEHPVRPVDPAAEVDPNLIDLVPGDPPVPITVWRTARTDTDAGRSIPTRLAARLVTAYSRPGEAVVDLTDDHSLTAACAIGRRRHHPAWFTEASSLIIGPATPPATDQTGQASTLDPAEDGGDSDGGVEPAELAAWFGDDLTDPDLPAPGEPATVLPPDASPHGATSLVAACWPLHELEAASRVRLAWLLTACARLLRQGGCLILVVGVPAGVTASPEDFSPVVSAAANAGLGYLQHIVAVAADVGDDAFVYHVTDEELLTLAHHTGGQQWAVTHLRAHADLLVFSKAHQAGARPSTAQRRGTPASADPAGRDGRRGGDRRG
jgi:hypothetical protein